MTSADKGQALQVPAALYTILKSAAAHYAWPRREVVGHVVGREQKETGCGGLRQRHEHLDDMAAVTRDRTP